MRHRLSRRYTHSLLVMAATVAIAIATIAYAIDDVELTFDVMHGPEWRAEHVRARLAMTPQGQRAQVDIRSVHFTSWPQPIRNVSIRCPDVQIGARELACRNARVHADVPALGGQQTFTASLRYGRATGVLELDLRNLELGAGTLALQASLHETQWRIRADFDNVPLATLVALAQQAQGPMPITVASGAATLRADIYGAGTQVSHVRAHGTLAALTLNNDSGSIATEGLAARFDVDLSQSDEEWQYRILLGLDDGQGYVEPIFVDFGTHALELATQGRLAGSLLVAESIRITHSDLLDARAHAVTIDLAHADPLRTLELELAQMRFPGAYEIYLEPFLIATSLKALRTSGQVTGALALHDGVPQRIELELRGIDVEGDEPLLAFRGLNGTWHWRASLSDEEAEPTSHLTWAGGHLYGLDFGAAQLHFVTTGRRFALLEPTSVPLLDGALELSTLSIRDVGSQQLGFNVAATIRPISVERLCRAFGWPQFGGQVSGSISDLQLEAGVLTLGTRLEARVFDGVLTVRDLRLDEPFGAWPRLFANIDFAGLDLELLTRAFSFGRITGRLSGGIYGLELFNWQPVAFAPRLYTVPGRTRQRISQRAVQNIGRIGGGGAGVTAALSSGFLRFFEEFNYARLGITCKLENEVCEMGGVGPAPNGGYYLVQGRGLPRIDVIGNARYVDWPQLIGQLAAATASGGPIVN